MLRIGVNGLGTSSSSHMIRHLRHPVSVIYRLSCILFWAFRRLDHDVVRLRPQNFHTMKSTTYRSVTNGLIPIHNPSKMALIDLHPLSPMTRHEVAIRVMGTSVLRFERRLELAAKGSGTSYPAPVLSAG